MDWSLRGPSLRFRISASGFRCKNGTWTPGPDFPNGLDVADGPAALLPDGNVLVTASPGILQNNTFFFEWDGSSLTQTVNPPNAPNVSSFKAT